MIVIGLNEEEQREIFYKVLLEYEQEDAYSVATEMYGVEYVDDNFTDKDFYEVAKLFEKYQCMDIADRDTYIECWHMYIEDK